jgi:imidazolonepropionase-like amidohydrolase
MKLALATRAIVPSLLAAVMLLATPAVASPQTAPPPIAFLHVNLVPMDSDRVLTDHAVVMQGSVITALGPTADVTVPPGAQTIDSHGQWLLPGLIDSHMHLLAVDELSLYLANGVTTVRNMSGEPMHLWWRREIKEGRMAGPTLETASPQFDSVPPKGTNRVIVTTREEAERAVDALAADYDLIKVYNGLTVEAYEGVADAARRRRAGRRPSRARPASTACWRRARRPSIAEVPLPPSTTRLGEIPEW